MIKLEFNPKLGIWSEDPESIEKLEKNFFGEQKAGKLFLTIEEALYLINFQNAKCLQNEKDMSFNDLASFYIKKECNLFIKYNAYRDWRDRGLIIHKFKSIKKKKTKKNFKKYPMKPLKTENINTKTLWYSDSFFSVLENKEAGEHLFNKYWFGQFGIYKQTRGDLLKLNFLETIFLAKYFGIKILDERKKELKPNEILNHVIKIREYTKQLYNIYEDWRLKGFIVKTGFKFGSHFRIYFPGASPVQKSNKWIHSKHVLHVFPKEQKLLISEWARVVRVAHSVKKTFLLAIPEMKDKDYIDYPVEYLAYRRKKEKNIWVRETLEDKPRYLLVPVSEDEHIGGIELASLLEKAKNMGLELILSISDRETSITYYILKKIILPGSKYKYYEIEWMKP